jgi:hypothetical protein
MNENVSSGEPEFSYRKNQDGTIDSICLHCFQTVCSCSDNNCAPAELKHKCNPVDVARMRIKHAESEMKT